MIDLLKVSTLGGLSIQRGDDPVTGFISRKVEALLVYRVGLARDHYRVPIDKCYQLVGVLRTKWHGLSGGTEVWQAIDAFFAGLLLQSSGQGAAHDA